MDPPGAPRSVRRSEVPFCRGASRALARALSVFTAAKPWKAMATRTTVRTVSGHSMSTGTPEIVRLVVAPRCVRYGCSTRRDASFSFTSAFGAASFGGAVRARTTTSPGSWTDRQPALEGNWHRALCDRRLPDRSRADRRIGVADRRLAEGRRPARSMAGASRTHTTTTTTMRGAEVTLEGTRLHRSRVAVARDHGLLSSGPSE